MDVATIPDDIFRDFVLNPEIASGFTLTDRQRVWLTFYQPAHTKSVTNRFMSIRATMLSQFVFNVARSHNELSEFASIWATRKCGKTERLYLSAAILRAINVPSKVDANQTLVWTYDGWKPFLTVEPPGNDSTAPP
jgi:hypothetical protein